MRAVTSVRGDVGENIRADDPSPVVQYLLYVALPGGRHAILRNLTPYFAHGAIMRLDIATLVQSEVSSWRPAKHVANYKAEGRVREGATAAASRKPQPRTAPGQPHSHTATRLGVSCY